MLCINVLLTYLLISTKTYNFQLFSTDNDRISFLKLTFFPLFGTLFLSQRPSWAFVFPEQLTTELITERNIYYYSLLIIHIE